jgi:hypothetical protein
MVLLAAGVLGAAGCTVAEDPASRPPLAGVVERLPAEAAGFRRGAVTDHERERPGYGAGVGYATPNRTAVATVQIYDRGTPRVPDDPSAPAIEAELNRSVREMLDVVPNRTGRSLVEQERTTVAPAGGGGPGLRCAVLRGDYGRTPVIERLCVGGASGYFLKVQVTADARNASAVDADAFISGIARAARGAGGGGRA